MNQQPDKLFREKLQSYSSPAPSSAWDRIDAGLDKKNHKGLWLKIAASLLIVALASYILWPKADPQVAPIATNHQIDKAPIVKDSLKKNDVVVTQEKQIANNEATNETTEVKEEKKNKVTKKNKVDVAVQPLQALKKEEPIETTTEEVVAMNEEPVQTVVASTQEYESRPAVAASENITLVFTVKEADEYLDKKSLAEATSDEKKPSTLKKLLKKAADLKTNQDPFGELRQKKNEILALNFKNDKQRGQNK